MKYEVILFDADETLFDFKKSERAALKSAMLDFQIEYDEEYHLSVYKEINTAIWKDFEAGLITQEKLKVERFERLSRRLNRDFDAAEFARVYIDHLSCASFLYDDSLELIEALHKNHRLVIVTNGLTNVQKNRIGKSSIAKHLEGVIISEEVRVSKPNPAIFQLALESIGHADKSTVLMVGDSLTSDIQGGLNFGIHTCWFNPSRTMNSTSIRPTYEISNLMELKPLL